MSHIKKIFCMLVVWVFGLGGAASALAANEILNVRHWVAPDHTRVVIDTSEDCEFTVEKERRGLSIDLDETVLPPHVPAVMLLNKPGVDRVMIVALPPTGLRVSLSMPEHAQATVFKLNKVEDKPFRIVIDIVLPEIARKESEARERVKITRKDRIVVIDPGHGGDAPGAVGKRGTLEKDVVLAIAKKLQGILNAKEGYRAFLTRIDDYYVSFQKRLQIAREYGANLFVSIHADAIRNRNVRGGSVYCLSTSGASSEAARILAQYENLADVVGGVPESEGIDDSSPIILDMFQNHTINQSKIFGNTVLKHLGDVNEIKFTSVQEAPFRVLKLPEIPSVLIETAYISNEKEEKLLRSDQFRAQVASAMAKSVFEFLPPLPLVAEVVSDPKETEKTQEKQKEPSVAKEPTGIKESLAAADGATVAKTSKEAVKPPAKQKEPTGTGEGATAKSTKEAVKPPEKQKEPPTAIESPGLKEAPAREEILTYRVRRGDTLGKIAYRHNTTIAVLLRLNKMKLSDRLLAGRLLKIPGVSTAQEKGEKQQMAERKMPPAAASGKTVYRVKRGDTLSGIAARHGTTTRVLMELNRIKRPDLLYVDRKLILPGA